MTGVSNPKVCPKCGYGQRKEMAPIDGLKRWRCTVCFTLSLRFRKLVIWRQVRYKV